MKFFPEDLCPPAGDARLIAARDQLLAASDHAEALLGQSTRVVGQHSRDLTCRAMQAVLKGEYDLRPWGEILDQLGIFLPTTATLQLIAGAASLGIDMTDLVHGLIHNRLGCAAQSMVTLVPAAKRASVGAEEARAAWSTGCTPCKVGVVFALAELMLRLGFTPETYRDTTL